MKDLEGFCVVVRQRSLCLEFLAILTNLRFESEYSFFYFVVFFVDNWRQPERGGLRNTVDRENDDISNMPVRNGVDRR